jgi:hypothetical protein
VSGDVMVRSRLVDDLAGLIRGGVPHGWQIRAVWNVDEVGGQTECSFACYEIQQGFDLFTVDAWGASDDVPQGWIVQPPKGPFRKDIRVISPDGSECVINEFIGQ